MSAKSMIGSLVTTSLILGASVISNAQIHAPKRTSFPERGSDKYWLAVDRFADRAIHFAYAKLFLETHGTLLTARQCQQYSRLAIDYEDQLTTAKQAGQSADSAFSNDVRAYSINMIGPPGVPIPLHRTSNYWVSTGSEAGDRDLRRIVSREIDQTSSQLNQTNEYLLLALNPECRNTGQQKILQGQP